MIYWTKPKTEYNEELEMYIEIGGLEEIKEFEGDYVPDGSGFEVDLNGVEYKDYLEAPEKYTVKEGKLEIV